MNYSYFTMKTSCLSWLFIVCWSLSFWHWWLEHRCDSACSHFTLIHFWRTDRRTTVSYFRLLYKHRHHYVYLFIFFCFKNIIENQLLCKNCFFFVVIVQLFMALLHDVKYVGWLESDLQNNYSKFCFLVCGIIHGFSWSFSVIIVWRSKMNVGLEFCAYQKTRTFLFNSENRRKKKEKFNLTKKRKAWLKTSGHYVIYYTKLMRNL